MYKTMELRGVRPSIATFGTLITAASDAGDVDAVKQVHKHCRVGNVLHVPGGTCIL